MVLKIFFYFCMKRKNFVICTKMWATNILLKTCRSRWGNGKFPIIMCYREHARVDDFSFITMEWEPCDFLRISSSNLFDIRVRGKVTWFLDFSLHEYPCVAWSYGGWVKFQILQCYLFLMLNNHATKMNCKFQFTNFHENNKFYASVGSITNWACFWLELS